MKKWVVILMVAGQGILNMALAGLGWLVNDILAGRKELPMVADSAVRAA